MSEQLDYEAVQRRLILLSSRPVRSKNERRERDRLISQTIMGTTGNLGAAYWATSDVISDFTAETDSASYEDAQKRYEAMLADPELAVDGWAESSDDTAWMNERSSFARKADQ